MIAEGNAWEQWKMRLWNQMVREFHTYPGLAPLEQWMRRSHKERRCLNCGEPGTNEVKSLLIACVRSYWLCAACVEVQQHRDAIEGMAADGLEVK